MSIFAAAAAALAIVALAVRVAGAQHRLLHLLQIEHYESARLILWLRRRGELLALLELVSVGAPTWPNVYFDTNPAPRS